MSSRNAFHGDAIDLIREDDDEPPVKRVRLAEDAVASIQHQHAVSETSLEVDHMILDYVAYQTIEACLSSRDLDRTSTSPQNLANNLAMSDSFLEIFKTKYAGFKPDEELRFRILLLRFATLFTQRLTRNPTTLSTEALSRIRDANVTRIQFTEYAHDLPSHHLNHVRTWNQLSISDDDIERNRAHVLHDLGVPPEEDDNYEPHYGTAAALSLVDLLPMFMELSALRNAMSESNLTDFWMQFAAEFMLQACLEQYLVCGATGVDGVDLAFSWGYRAIGASVTEDGTDGMGRVQSHDVNQMFEEDDLQTEVEGWSETKLEYLQLLGPNTQMTNGGNSTADRKTSVTEEDLVAHLESLASQHPIKDFEQSMLTFLSALANSISKPVLAQLEKGKLEGMSEIETEEFVSHCGSDVAAFFREPLGFERELA